MNDLQVNLEKLKKIPLFQKLSRNSLTTLLQNSRVEGFEENDLVFSEGQRGDRFFIVLDGGVRISRQIEGVGEKQLSVCRENSYFGELAMIDNSPRSADARAVESTKLLVVHKSKLEELMFADNAFASEVLWVFVRHLSTRLRESNEKLRAAYQMDLM